jgi:PAS domain S-box-containing protein
MTTPEEGALAVLHVDDDPALGELVQLYLERDDVNPECTVRTETSPAAALDVLRAEDGTFDCVISDYSMPDMNGIEFVEAVRETHPELPVLLFSGEETDEIAAEIIRAGLSDYLQKGVGADKYTMLIRRVEHAVESEGQFDPEVETELDGVGVVGHDERFERADDAYASFYRYDASDVVGKHWSELHPEEEVEHIRTHVLPVVREGGKWSGRSEGLRADGSTFTESKMVTALDDGRLLIAVSEIDEETKQSDG